MQKKGVTSLKYMTLQHDITIQIYDITIQICDITIQTYDIEIQIYDIRIKTYDMTVQIYDNKNGKWGEQTSSAELLEQLRTRGLDADPASRSQTDVDR